MGRFVSFFLLMFLFIGMGNTWGQELTEEEQQIIEDKYYNNLDYYEGAKLSKANQLKAALPYYQKAVETFKQEKEWKAYLEVHTKIVIAYRSSEDYLSGLAAAEAAIGQVDKNNKALHSKIGALYAEMSWVCYFMKNNKKGIKYCQDALGLLNRNDTPKIFGIVHNALGSHFITINKLQEAEKSWKITEEIYANEEICHNCKGNLGSVSINLGLLYRVKGNHDKAIKYIKKGATLASELYGTNSLNVVNHYYNLADFYRILDEKKLSNTYFKKVIFIIEESKTDDEYYLKRYLPECYYYLGVNNIDLNNWDKASTNLKKAQSIYEEEEDLNFLEVQISTGMGKINTEIGVYETAMDYFQKADSLLTVLKDTGTIAGRYSFNGDVYLNTSIAQFWNKQGNQVQAIDHYKKALQAISNHTNNDWVGDNSWVSDLIAQAYFQTQQIDSAMFYNQQSLIFGCKNYKSDDFMQLPELNNLEHETTIHSILSLKAKLLAFSANQEQTISKKEELYTKAIATIDLADKFHTKKLRQGSVLRANNYKLLINYSLDSYGEGVSIAYDYHQSNPSQYIREKAFYYTQKMKAQQLWLTLLKGEAANYGKLDKELLEQERDLLSDISYYENEIFAAQQNQDTAQISKIENEHLFKTKSEYNKLVQTIETQYPEYYESKYAFVAETAESLQKILENDELLIEYVLIDTTLFIFTIAKNSPLQLHKINLDKQISDNIDDYKTLLTNSTLARPASRERFINLSYQLYQQFLQPIEDQLADKNRLIIIGDGMTNYIPFETLLASNKVKPFKDLDFLIKNHEISYHYSSTLFAKAKRKAQTNNQGIFAFAPVYDNENTTASVMRSDYVSIDSTLRAITEDGYFSPLPESENEVNAIIDLFEKVNTKATNTLVLRQEATEEALKINLEKPYRFAHIAGHSFADLKNPKFSGIACFKEENRDSTTLSEDGTLFTGEIYNISSKADLVTLSSCESGFGKLEKTEGLLGLNRAFIYAGTPNVVFSLWKVYDKVSANLMVDFYENVLEGENYAASLRKAKLKLLEKEATAAPHFWSPFLLIGR